MSLSIIGLGLGDERDVTVRGADAIRAADIVFLEAYTSILATPLERLEEVYGKRIRVAHRETVESESDSILGPARAGQHVAFLVVGDPFGATTHTDLLLRARKEGIPVSVVHNASILNAAGACGLQLYSFGAVVSLPFFREEWRPDSWYDRIAYNAGGGLHTLALLDIKVREPNFEALTRTGVLGGDSSSSSSSLTDCRRFWGDIGAWCMWGDEVWTGVHCFLRPLGGIHAYTRNTQSPPIKKPTS